MNTRKDFKRAAQMIRNSTQSGSVARKVLEDAFVSFFATDNPRFDVSRFLDATGNESEVYGR